MENIEIRDLPPVGLEVTGYYGNKSTFLKLPDGTTECRFASPWLSGKIPFFRVDLVVVYGKLENTQDSVRLTGREADRALQHVIHMVKSFKKKALG